MQCINDRTYGNDHLHKSPRDYVFHKVDRGDENRKNECTQFLVHATSDIKKDTALSSAHDYVEPSFKPAALEMSDSSTLTKENRFLCKLRT